jgi:integrase
MSRRKAVEPPPCGVRTLPSGRITLQIRATHQGKRGRYSQHTLDPRQPESYATMAEAKAGYDAVIEYLAQQVDRDATVRGFAERWLDDDDPRWGLLAMPKRGHAARYSYASSIRAFVEMFADRPMASMTEADVRAYQRTPGSGYAPSQMVVISTFLLDAERDGLRIGNPAKGIAKEAGDALRWRRDKTKPKAPSLEQVNAALAHLRRHLDVYPRGLYGWLLTGARTGMRGGELDGMTFDGVSDDVYDIRHQLHYRSNELEAPKWGSRRTVWLPPEVVAEIRIQRRDRMAMDWQEPYIWLNTEGGPWRHDARDKWWAKQVGGTSLRQICGDVPIYNATRHHWASHTLNVVGMQPFQVAALFGHKDGGKVLIERYVDVDYEAAARAVQRAYQSQPLNLNVERIRRDAEGER